MDNQIDNNFRSFIAIKSSANTSSTQIANSSFFKKHYHSAWNDIGLSPEVSRKISEHLQLTLSRMDQNQQHDRLIQSTTEGSSER